MTCDLKKQHTARSFSLQLLSVTLEAHASLINKGKEGELNNKQHTGACFSKIKKSACYEELKSELHVLELFLIFAEDVNTHHFMWHSLK